MCISNSVGQGGHNDRIDVKTIQILLNLYASMLGRAKPLAEDGLAGADTINAIEAFQTKVMGMQNPDRQITPGGAALARFRDLLAQAPKTVKLKGALVGASEDNVNKFADALAKKMLERQINTSLRQAHFLAQIGHESGELRYTEELASGDAYEGSRELGNDQPGDGARFKGRGLIQLTGRANYVKYGQAIGRDLITNGQWEQVAQDPELAVDVACWYWDTHNLNEFADRDDVRTITRKINAAEIGLDNRKALLARAKYFVPTTI